MALKIDPTALVDPPAWREFSLAQELVGGYMQISGNSAEVELIYGHQGQSVKTESMQVSPGSYNVGRSPDGKPLTGIRARNATGGLPATLAGYFWDISSPTLSFVGEVPATGGAVVGVPVGGIIAWGSGAVPNQYLLCDGQAVSRTTYAELFAAIGTIYGVGDGATTFNVPDLRGRVPVGLGTNASVNALGVNDGVTVANRRPQHRHTPHSHTVNTGDAGNQGSVGQFNTLDPSSVSTSSVDGGSGVATDALNAPAHLVVNWIIAAGV